MTFRYLHSAVHKPISKVKFTQDLLITFWSGEGVKRRKWTSYRLFELQHCNMYSEAAISRDHHKIHSLQVTRHLSTPYILLHIVFNTSNCVSLLDHYTTWYPTYGKYFKTSFWHFTFEYPGRYCLPYLRCHLLGGLPLLQAPFQFL